MAEETLQRKLGLFPATNIVVANMIGAGIFTTSGLLMAGLNDPLLMMILWVVGGIIAICGALSYGELGAAMPGAGGEYLFLSKLYHPLFGFLSGWVSLWSDFQLLLQPQPWVSVNISAGRYPVYQHGLIRQG